MAVINLASKTSILVIILAAAFGLRLWQFDQYPAMGETIDEYAYTWLGHSILSGEPPTSWSWFDHYETVEMKTMAGRTFRIVQPWFDSPPLFSLIPGFMVKIRGAETIQLPSIRAIRFPMLILGVINVWLTYLVARMLFTVSVGLMAAALYATIPAIVYGSRMVVTENLIITWLLLSIVIVLKYLDERKNLYLLCLGIIGGLALLTKLTGILVLATSTLWLARQKRIGDAIHVTLVGLMVGGLWLIMGWKYGMDIFLQSILAQSGLKIGFGTSLNLWLRPNIVDSLLADGWLVLGLVTLFGVTMFHSKLKEGYTLLVLVFGVWLLILMGTVGEHTWHGWYRYPVYPVMTIALASILSHRKYQLTSWFVVLVLAVLPTLRLIFVNLDLVMPGLLTRVLLLLVFGITLGSIITPFPQKLAKPLAIAMLVLSLGVNVTAVITTHPERLYQDSEFFYFE